MNRRLAQIETRYRAQFTALDTLVSSMQKTSQYLTQQLANLPSTSN
jgi:flagellar hook-associated protein 2